MQKVVKNTMSNYSPENRWIGKKIEEDVRVERGGYAYKYGGGQASAKRKNATGWVRISPFQNRFKPSVVSAHKTDATHKKLITNTFARVMCASGESLCVDSPVNGKADSLIVGEYYSQNHLSFINKSFILAKVQ